MDIPAPAAHNQRAGRFLPMTTTRAAAAASSEEENELHEDDIFSSPSSQSSSSSSSSSSSLKTTALVSRLTRFPAAPPDACGILAALPDHHHPSSASRLIPPKPPQERLDVHQSAPLDVPILSQSTRRPLDFFSAAAADDDDLHDAHMVLPPHEMLAAADSPRLSSSVLEGAGRTLKGRDLRQVRNAIFRHTGFLD